MVSCPNLGPQPERFDAGLALQFFARAAGAGKRLPPERLSRAIAEELTDLCERTLASLQKLPLEQRESDPGQVAAAALARALEAGVRWAPGVGAPPRALGFPRRVLEVARERAHTQGLAALSAELELWLGKYHALSARVAWLLNGTCPRVLQTLDPLRDADRIHHALTAAFRAQGRVLELLAINRIAQASGASLFIRSTKEAETNGVARFFDTWSLLANFYEWGEDSLRGRAAAAKIRQIHGRYHIPDSGMKYVLLESAFTWLEAAERLGHRPLSELERRGYFHASVKLGLAIGVAELSHDYDAMYAWYRAFNREHRAHRPLKAQTFEALVDNSLGGGAPCAVRAAVYSASRAGMDEEYLSALGYAAPPAEERRAVQAVFTELASTLERAPRSPFLRSLQDNPARSAYSRPHELGVSERSPHLPGSPGELPSISWEELGRHASPESLWVAIEGDVYDLTGFAALHPGGLAALLAVAGKDATAAFRVAAHSAATQIFKLNYRIARVR
jgi:hypothetical protein